MENPQHTPTSTSTRESSSPSPRAALLLSNRYLLWLLGTPIGQHTSESKKESFWSWNKVGLLVKQILKITTIC